MSGKGNSNNKSGKKSGKSGNSSKNPEQEPPQVSIVSGWEYHTYARNSDRYQYIGKDEDTGEPEFIDYGPKGGR